MNFFLGRIEKKKKKKKKKTLWEKKKMLVTSIFSFYHNVFKRLFKQGRVKSGMCGKELSILSHFDSVEDVRI